MGSEIKWYN